MHLIIKVAHVTSYGLPVYNTSHMPQRRWTVHATLIPQQSPPLYSDLYFPAHTHFRKEAEAILDRLLQQGGAGHILKYDPWSLPHRQPKDTDRMALKLTALQYLHRTTNTQIVVTHEIQLPNKPIQIQSISDPLSPPLLFPSARDAAIHLTQLAEPSVQISSTFGAALLRAYLKDVRAILQD